MKTLSLIVPFYNEQSIVQTFFQRLTDVVEKLDGIAIEYVCVDDGSQDDTVSELEKQRLLDQRMTIIQLSRNFGKEAALTAGIEYAKGDAVIPLDADLQDPPELIIEMVAEWRKGYEVVLAKRKSRSGDNILKRVTAAAFYKLFNATTSVQIPENVGDFRLMDRSVVDAVLALPENQRFMKGIFAWVGFSSTTIEFERPQRVGAKSKQSYPKLINLAFTGFTSHGVGLLRLWMFLGFLFSSICLVFASVVAFNVILFGADVPGYASLLTAIIFFGSLQMLGLGLIGEYLGRIFMEAKRRPNFVIKEMTNSKLTSDIDKSGGGV